MTARPIPIMPINLKPYNLHDHRNTMRETTTIEITTENWQWLNSKKNPGESFNDVLDRLRLDEPQGETPAIEPPSKLDVPGSGESLEARRATLARMYTYLMEEETATKADLIELVDPEYVGYSSRESFWSNCIKGRDTLRAIPGVQAPGEGEHTWRYVGRYGD